MLNTLLVKIHSSIDSILQSKKRFYLALFLCVAGLLLLCLNLGFIWLFLQQSKVSHTDPQACAEIDSSPQVELPSPVATPSIWIDVGGGVNKPGIYVLSINSRVNDAIEAAGGISKNADLVALAQEINLAKKITDSEKILIPSQAFETEENKVKSQTKIETISSKISINSAEEKDLETIPGLGEQRVKAIIANRPYSSLEELHSKAKIPASIIEKAKDLLEL